METDNFHREAIKMVLEAAGRGAFEVGNDTERDLFFKDMKEIVAVGREKLTKIELDYILSDMIQLTQKSIIYNQTTSIWIILKNFFLN